MPFVMVNFIVCVLSVNKMYILRERHENIEVDSVGIFSHFLSRNKKNGVIEGDVGSMKD